MRQDSAFSISNRNAPGCSSPYTRLSVSLSRPPSIHLWLWGFELAAGSSQNAVQDFQTTSVFVGSRANLQLLLGYKEESKYK